MSAAATAITWIVSKLGVIEEPLIIERAFTG